MAAGPSNRYSGQVLQPARNPGKAKPDAVRLNPGTYPYGQLLGQSLTYTAANDVQTLSVTGTPTGGSFLLNFNGDTIGPVLYNSTAAQLQALLDADPQIGAANTLVSGGPLPGTALVITFQNLCGNLLQPVMTILSNSLTGGSSPTPSVAHTTSGAMAGGGWGIYNHSLTGTGFDTAKSILQFAVTVDVQGNVHGPGGMWNETNFTAPVWTSGEFYAAEIVGLDSNAVTALVAHFNPGDVTTISTAGTIIIIP
jgi:hypothetical protein